MFPKAAGPFTFLPATYDGSNSLHPCATFVTIHPFDYNIILVGSGSMFITDNSS